MEQNSMETGTKKCRKVSRKKNKVDYFDLLPDDLLLNILQKLLGDVLRYKTRFVCKLWFSLTTNRILLDHVSLILEPSSGSHRVRLMDISEEEQELKMNKRYFDIPYSGRIKSWCNEYLLITDLKKQGSLYIYDVVTKQGSLLPPCSTSRGEHYSGLCGVGLSYDKFKGIYKVVHVLLGPNIQCELLILKGDITSYNSLEWKKLNTPCYKSNRRYYWGDPVSVQGRYLHWDVYGSEYLASMDTVQERFIQTRLPGDVSWNKYYFLVEMGGFLTLLHKSYDKINIWVLKDYQRSRWENFQSVDISSYALSRSYPGSLFPSPVTYTKSKSYIIFRISGSEAGLYSYDLKNKILRRLDVPIGLDERWVVRSSDNSMQVVLNWGLNAYLWSSLEKELVFST